MYSKHTGTVTLVLAVALFLVASVAQAKTFTGSFIARGSAIAVFSDFSLDGSTVNAALSRHFHAERFSRRCW